MLDTRSLVGRKRWQESEKKERNKFSVAIVAIVIGICDDAHLNRTSIASLPDWETRESQNTSDSKSKGMPQQVSRGE